MRLNYGLQTFRRDILGGLTAAVVALPLALAYGIVSGMGAAAGLYGAIAVGFCAAVFGGTATQISGPTAPIAILMGIIIASHTSTMAEALTVVVLAGVMQALLGALKLGRFVAYTPHVVIAGFLSAIGILVMAIQVLPILGLPTVPGGAVGMVRALPHAVQHINADALAIGCTTLAVAALWPARLSRILPAPLAGLCAGTLLGVLWLGDAPIIGPIPAGLPPLHLELPSLDFLPRAIQPALSLALIGSVVSLLTSLAADSMTRTTHDPERELIGQGVGNMAAGFVGGLPGAGTPVYTVSNIRAGGQTRMAGVVFAVLILALLLGLSPYVSVIPRAALAGVLMKVGWDLVDWSILLRLRQLRREHAIIFLATLVTAVFVSLIGAVVVGLIISAWVRAAHVQMLELDSVISVPLLDSTFLYIDDEPEDADPFEARVGMIVLKGSLTVASSRKLIETISVDIKEHEVVIFDFRDAGYIDDSAAMVVRQLIDLAAEEGTPTIAVGVSGQVADTLADFDVLHSVSPRNAVATLDDARDIAREVLGLDQSPAGSPAS